MFKGAGFRAEIGFKRGCCWLRMCAEVEKNKRRRKKIYRGNL
jgi:hypothetical protein